MKSKNVPVRTCVGCRTAKEKSELIRYVVADKVGVLDETGHAPGRGVYVCKDSPECLKKAIKKGRIQKNDD